MVALNNRLRLRGFSLMLGIIPALKIALRLALESKPPSRLRYAPLRSSPTSLATCFNAGFVANFHIPVQSKYSNSPSHGRLRLDHHLRFGLSSALLSPILRVNTDGTG